MSVDLALAGLPDAKVLNGLFRKYGLASRFVFRDVIPEEELPDLPRPLVAVVAVYEESRWDIARPAKTDKDHLNLLANLVDRGRLADQNREGHPSWGWVTTGRNSLYKIPHYNYVAWVKESGDIEGWDAVSDDHDLGMSDDQREKENRSRFLDAIWQYESSPKDAVARMKRCNADYPSRFVVVVDTAETGRLGMDGPRRPRPNSWPADWREIRGIWERVEVHDGEVTK